MSLSLDYTDIMHLNKTIRRTKGTPTETIQRRIHLTIVDAIKLQRRNFQRIPPDSLLLLGESIPKKTRKASQMQPSTNRRINQDICALKQSYLTNQKDFRHETNFHEF
uniref:Uncharacterized protein n=1 Tax=Brassica oleracea TaxID=3712 RepID=A0A3P6AND0_BRAOL|nr:unnamed protein product [Brassica oleracea]